MRSKAPADAGLKTAVLEGLLVPAVSEVHRKHLAPVSTLIGVGTARGDDGLPGQLYRVTIASHRESERLALRQLCDELLALDALQKAAGSSTETVAAYERLLQKVRLHVAREQA